MRVFTYSEARQRLSEVLDTAREEQVIIRRRGGDTFSVVYTNTPESPLDIAGLETQATTQDILHAIRESRSRGTGRAGARRRG